MRNYQYGGNRRNFLETRPSCLALLRGPLAPGGCYQNHRQDRKVEKRLLFVPLIATSEDAAVLLPELSALFLTRTDERSVSRHHCVAVAVAGRVP